MAPAENPNPRSLCLRPLEYADNQAVRDFNNRLQSSGTEVPFLLPEWSAERCSHPKQPWLLLAGNDIRGGVLLTQHRARIGSDEQIAVNIQAPLTEAVINPQFASLSVGLFREIQRRFTFAYAVGMGGLDKPMPRLLKALKWQVDLTPFRFVPLNVGRVATSVKAIRDRIPPLLMPFTELAGTLVTPLFRQVLSIRGARDLGVVSKAEESTAAVAVAWAAMSRSINFGLTRDINAAAALYAVNENEIVLQRRSDPRCVAVVRIRHLDTRSPFAGLTVATVLELLAPNEREVGLLSRQVLGYLARCDVDIAVTNISNAAHVRSLDGSGWLRGPSNYVLALSPAMASAGVTADTSYVTRTDGDGRLNL
jgi:hypothetical protein